MLLSLVLQITPLQPATLPADQGRALAALFLDWLRQADSALSADLHKDSETRPFTISNLRGVRPSPQGQIVLDPEYPLWWRVTALTAPLSQAVKEQILPALPAEITIADQPFRLQAATFDPQQHPWAGAASYETLAAGNLLAAHPPSDRLTVEFASPTTFHRAGKHLPFPLPSLLVNQWLGKWNAFAPITFPQELVEYADAMLAVSRYELRSQAVRFGPSTLIGCVGRCTYRILERDPYRLRLLHTLAAYAFYCGTGAKTSFGLGQTRVIET